MTGSAFDAASAYSGLWYLGRGTGVAALLLLTVNVVLGITARSGRPLPGLPRFAVAVVHRDSGLLAVILLAIHLGTLLLDPYAQLRLADLVVPFLGSYRPAWLGLGTLAADLVLALVLTSMLRHRLGQRGWRAVHWLAYLAWPVAVLHALGAGSDAGRWWLRLLAGACLAAVAAGFVWRTSAAFSATVRAPSVASPRRTEIPS